MLVKNLMGAPYDLVNDKGEKVRLPARGEVELTPHHMHEAYYRRAPYLRISESAPVQPVQEAPEEPQDDDIDTLRAQYAELAEKPADGRWSVSRLRTEIDNLLVQ